MWYLDELYGWSLAQDQLPNGIWFNSVDTLTLALGNSSPRERQVDSLLALLPPRRLLSFSSFGG